MIAPVVVKQLWKIWIKLANMYPQQDMTKGNQHVYFLGYAVIERAVDIAFYLQKKIKFKSNIPSHEAIAW